MRKHPKSLIITALLLMPIGIFISLAGIVTKVIKSYFLVGYNFWK